MWKAMMFSVWPVRTASAALKTRRQTLRYQSSDTINIYLYSCICSDQDAQVFGGIIKK